MKNWNIHICRFDSYCMQHMDKGDPITRLYIRTPFTFVMVALRKRDTWSKAINWDPVAKKAERYKRKWLEFSKPRPLAEKPVAKRNETS